MKPMNVKRFSSSTCWCGYPLVWKCAVGATDWEPCDQETARHLDGHIDEVLVEAFGRAA